MTLGPGLKSRKDGLALQVLWCPLGHQLLLCAGPFSFLKWKIFFKSVRQ